MSDNNIPAQKAMASTSPSHYKLKCRLCGAFFPDNGFILQCIRPHSPALLTTEYQSKSFEPDKRKAGLPRYQSWLPTSRPIIEGGRSIIYQSRNLGKITGLSNLWIAF